MTYRVLVFSSGATVTHTRGLLSLSTYFFFFRENDDGAQLINNDCKNSLCVHVDGWMRRIKLSTQHRRYRRNLNKKNKNWDGRRRFSQPFGSGSFQVKRSAEVAMKKFTSSMKWLKVVFCVCVHIFFSSSWKFIWFLKSWWCCGSRGRLANVVILSDYQLI